MYSRLAIAQTYIKKVTTTEEAHAAKVRALLREARKNVAGILAINGSIGEIKTVIQQLRADMVTLSRETSRDIARITQNYTAKQLEMAGLDTITANVTLPNTETVTTAIDAIMLSSPIWLDTLEASLNLSAVQMRLSDADKQALLDRMTSTVSADGRASIFQLAGATAETEEAKNVWTLANLITATYLFTLNEQNGQIYKKQAIATIDKRTTDCCLKVHGQIQPLNKPFKLTGTPRFSDYVNHPPFHWNCRTTEVLYNPAFEEFGITTGKIIDAAQAEIKARAETGKRVDIYPSHATARRP